MLDKRKNVLRIIIKWLPKSIAAWIFSPPLAVPSPTIDNSFDNLF